MASYTYFAAELGDHEHTLGCECCRWSSGDDLPIPKKLATEEIAVLARKLAHSIFTDWTELNRIVKRYEEVISRRWLKKGFKQRRAILLQCWPGMAPTHRPDFVSFRKGAKNTVRSRTLLSKSYLWPSINLEDLQQRHLLLLFINSRGRKLPDEFVSMDIEAAHLGKGWHFSEDDTLPTHTETVADCDSDQQKEITIMLLHGQHNPRTYGRLVSTQGSASTVQRLLSLHPQRGLLGLEIQCGIYRFLLDSCKLILHDVEPAQFFLAPHKGSPAVPRQEPSEYSSFGAHSLESPYCVPQLLDLPRIKTLVDVRRSAAEDHLWLLQDDPSYFCESLKDWKEHDPYAYRHSCSGCCKRVAAFMIVNARQYFVFWAHISNLLARLPPLEDQLKRADAATLSLPTPAEKIWAELLEIVDWLLAEPIGNLRVGVPPSPRLRHCFEWSTKRAPGDGVGYSRHLKMNVPDPERRVTGLFWALVDPEQCQLHSLNHIMQEMQYMLETDAAASELVDPWITSQVADLALLSELKLRIEGLQPWHTSWKARKINESDPVRAYVDDLVISSGFYREFIFESCQNYGHELLTDPFDGRLDYPITRAYTKANVNQMRRAERALDGFWADLDADLKIITRTSFTSSLKKLMSPRKKHRTPPWKEPVKASTPESKPNTKMPLRELNGNTPISQPTPFSTPQGALPRLSTPKTKVKTRGVPVPSAPEQRPATPPTERDETPAARNDIESVPVSKRTFHVLDALMPAATSASHQRAEVAWNDLLAAVVELGFIPEKLYGSVWIFKPTETGKCKVDVARSISFHEPKEVRKGHKIPTNMVRTFGRRLKHAYGWCDGMFTLETRKGLS